MKYENYRRKIKSTTLNTLNYNGITSYPHLSWESNTMKIISVIAATKNFKASLSENSYNKIKVEYKNLELEWITSIPYYLNNGNPRDGSSLIFPRHLCYDIPISDLKNFHLAVTALDEYSDGTYSNYYYPTFRFLEEDVIVVDLGILGPSGNCPDDKWSEYFKILFKELASIENTNTVNTEPPDFCTSFYVESSKYDIIVETRGHMIFHTFAIDNKFKSLGDLRLAIDELMKELDDAILLKL